MISQKEHHNGEKAAQQIQTGVCIFMHLCDQTQCLSKYLQHKSLFVYQLSYSRCVYLNLGEKLITKLGCNLNIFFVNQTH